MNQFNIFRTALMFYTRIPVGNINNYESSMLSKSTRYFPIIGLIVGALTAGVYWLLSLILPNAIALLLSMAFSVYLTGAFHEDGFADFCDGFGGGYTKEKVLTIMKDSRIGTYGTVGLAFVLATKFIALNEISPIIIMATLIAGHTLSRLIPVILLYTSSYVREDATSKSKPIGHKDSVGAFIFSILTGLIPFIWLSVNTIIIFTVAITIVTIIFRRYITKKIGGYTGDVLGALQQISEVVFYLVIVSLTYTQWSLF